MFPIINQLIFPKMTFSLEQVNKAADYWLGEIVSHSNRLHPICNKTCLSSDVHQYLLSRVQSQDRHQKRRFSQDIFKPKQDPIPYNSTQVEQLLEKLQSLSQKGSPEAQMALDFHDFLKGNLIQTIYHEQLETSYITPSGDNLLALHISHNQLINPIKTKDWLRSINLSPSQTGDKALQKHLDANNKPFPDIEEVLGFNYSQTNTSLQESLYHAGFQLPSLTHLPSKTMILYENGGIEVLERGKNQEILISVPNDTRPPSDIPANQTQHGFDEETLALILPYLMNIQAEKS